LSAAILRENAIIFVDIEFNIMQVVYKTLLVDIVVAEHNLDLAV